MYVVYIHMYICLNQFSEALIIFHLPCMIMYLKMDQCDGFLFAHAYYENIMDSNAVGVILGGQILLQICRAQGKKSSQSIWK